VTTADIVIDAVNQLRISLAFVEPPEKLGRPRIVEPLLFKAAFWSVNTILATLIVVLFVGSRIPPFTPQLDITPERLAKLTPPAPDLVALRKAEEAKRADEEARRKKMEQEAAEARRAKLAEGRLGHPDSTRKETVMPKGREDVLREKVQKVGILSALGRAKAPGSSLSNLLSSETADIEQAVVGLEGAKLSMGKGTAWPPPAAAWAAAAPPSGRSAPPATSTSAPAAGAGGAGPTWARARAPGAGGHGHRQPRRRGRPVEGPGDAGGALARRRHQVLLRQGVPAQPPPQRPHRSGLDHPRQRQRRSGPRGQDRHEQRRRRGLPRAHAQGLAVSEGRC
jgi:hypothetical protein